MDILLADDHALFRQGIRYILLEYWMAMGEFLEADSLSSTLSCLSTRAVDLVLLDLIMPDMQGERSLKQVIQASGSTPVVVISAVQDSHQISLCRHCGVAGFIPKNSEPRTLVSALRLILDGGSYFPRSMAEGGVKSLPASLTRRQREVLMLMADGLSNKAIARRLEIAETTVKNHVTAIFQLLQVENRMQAVNRARLVGDL